MKVRLNTHFICLLALSAVASQAMAYEEDTHFQVTYVICRVAGMTHAEAIKVAAVDQGMDDSSGTVANGGLGGIIPNVDEEWKWHALDKGGKMFARGVLERKELLFTKACTRKTVADRLFYLGVFFHYQQDTWAHRHHYDGQPHSYDRFTTYDTPIGHARHGHQPDRPPFDPVAAIMDLEDGLKYAKLFMVTALGRQPRAYVRDYHPQGGVLLDSWTDRRKGKFFHQLAPDGAPGSARQFLTQLIRYQIHAYPTSTDANPFFLLRETADEVPFDTARVNLQGVCNTFAINIGDQINIPSKQDKVRQSYTRMTTAQLEKGLN